MREGVARQHWYAVRCCCQPQRILGFLPLDLDIRANTEVLLRDRLGRDHVVKIRKFMSVLAPVSYESPEELVQWRTEWAVYSDDVDVTQWQAFHGFIAIGSDSQDAMESTKP